MNERDSAAEVVTLEELKHHLRVEHDADDDLIQSFGLAAAEYAEHICDRQIVRRDDSLAVCDSISDVPASIKTWIKLYVTDLYERRSLTEGGEFKIRNYDHLLDRWIIYDRIKDHANS
ncbi:head-tail connector protein [Parasutterella muris]|uniref:Phage gp6-like head-tail connector protein n=1 Tax=Parasutterella muris TaxID=2565572 RepID=A0A6L6YIV6_9BURK|nr:head-tail connector protein [Parasutterella muris]MVX56792.1 phage gp6-like head-tail connector protein [Parasutterella muris]